MIYRSVLHAVIVCCAFIAALPAQAVTLLRDAEVEHGLAKMAQPILQAAGLSASRTKILLVDDPSLNAFVINGSAIFIHSGLVMRVERVEQLQAVIAHEAAHIANGHMARRAANFKNAQTAAGIGTALSLLAGAATDNAGAGAAAAAGAIRSSQRRFFGHTRAEEASADQSGVRYMVRAGVDPAAASELMELFRGQEALNVGRQDPYVRTHPLSRDRVRALDGLAAANSGDFPTDKTADYWFRIVQGKVTAYERAASWTLRKTRGKNDYVSTMRRAVAYQRKPDRKRAYAAAADLLKIAPNNPYAHELQADIFLDNRDFDRAVRAYARAVNLAPNQPLILGGYGRALLAQNTPASNKKALEVLRKAVARDALDSRNMRDLAGAYAKAGNRGMASLLTAERYALAGRLKDAEVHAKRAAGLLSRGSAPWQRAQDVLSASQNAKRKR
ncbi:M48 family metalloprotease [Nereida sp. MMG025]|uniref:M48 family metalloprotease n=1 Tax=Nereida sp. MMG025 TaxID=2909981 RepID=UPI001F00B1A3|nr:M48 family metalloprotease [Nereida sp. MMG025]MCF6443652.1 M48 family metalloprotease [Nereida sp. MMG025]